ncbi:MAG: ATP/GTP-binding protein [Candidatus Jordarchaeum sp.]|uniref:ATP/GTP-binding protein n=1 Tax=Candidatus Jordarchaeum sp. TaxID=2823881 RepID=UPI004049BF48
MFTCFFIGTAGSGKSTLTKAYHEWLIRNEFNTALVNLDPGVRRLPYSPDVDIREYIVLEEVMDKYDLGPNGGLIASIDMMANFIDDFKEEIEELKPLYVLVDTPGQLELFAFRSTGPLVTTAISSKENCLVFLMDPLLSRSPSGFVSVLLLSASVQYRFNLPQINILSKADTLSEEEIERIIEWVDEPEKLLNAIDQEAVGLRREISLNLGEIFTSFGLLRELIPISALTLEGLDNLYAILERIYTDQEGFI